MLTFLQFCHMSVLFRAISSQQGHFFHI